MRQSSDHQRHVRNLMRGMQDTNNKKSAARAFSNLRTTMSLEEVQYIENELRANPLYTHLGIPPEFPEQPCCNEDYTRLATRSLTMEAASIVHRANSSRDKIVGFFNDLSKLNSNILRRNLETAHTQLCSLFEQYGHSLLLLKKLAFIYTHSSNNTALQDKCLDKLKQYGLRSKNLITVGIVDVMGETYDFISIRNNLLSIQDKGESNKFTRDILSSIFTPIFEDQTTLQEQLQSHFQASLIDAVSLLLIHAHNLEMFNVPGNQVAGVLMFDQSILESWKRLSSGGIPDNHYYDPKELHSDFDFYRQSIAWTEIKQVSLYRTTFNNLYLDQDRFSGTHGPIETRLLREFFSDLKSLKDLTLQPQKIDLIPYHFNPNTAGVFVATCAFLYGELRPSIDPLLPASDLLLIMNRTRDVSKLCSAGYLKRLSDVNKNEHLFELIIEALLADKSTSKQQAHRFRRILQNYVLNYHHGDLREFLISTSAAAPAVAENFFGILDEEFLIQLFLLFEESGQVFETRANLHEWYSKEFNSPDHMDMAKTLRIDRRIQAVIDDIDDTRLYVDPTKFRLWLEDNVLDDLSSVLRTQPITIADVDGIEKPGDFIDQRDPEWKLAKIFASAYGEFCTNTVFGISSYLGRRIRHGTLKGVMLTNIKDIIGSQHYSSILGRPQTERIISKWLDTYEKHVLRLAERKLQICENPKHKDGAIHPDVFAPEKRGELHTAILDIHNIYRSRGALVYVFPAINMYCWRLLENDLVAIRKHLSDCQHAWGTLSADEICHSLPPELHSQGRNFVREVNAKSHANFKTLASWFNKPVNSSPSADLKLLFDALIKEVKERSPKFNPKVQDKGLASLEVKGGAYHLIYDALSVVIRNAAEHGKVNGILIREMQLNPLEHNQSDLTISVSSELKDTDDLQDVQNEITTLLADDHHGAMISEGRSGIRKLMNLKNSENELVDVRFETSDAMLKVSCTFRLHGRVS